MTKLYEVANEYARLLDSDIAPEDIADTVEGMEGELTDKIAQLLAICKNEQVYAEALRCDGYQAQTGSRNRHTGCQNQNRQAVTPYPLTWVTHHETAN